MSLNKGKCKVPLQAQCGPEGSRRFRLPDFHDIQHMKVVRLSAAFTPRNVPGTHFHWGLGHPRAVVQSEGSMSLKNPVTPPGIDPGTVQLVAQYLYRYTTPGP